MTLPYSPSRAVYEGNGAATAFPFAFKIWSTDQLGVSVTSPEGVTVEAQGWTASMGENGGTVTYLHDAAPLPTGWRLAIVRDMPFAQGIDLVSASRFDPQVIEDGLDQATAELQQLNERITRSVILPPTSDQSPQDVVAAIYASRDAAAASATTASSKADAAAVYATAASDSASTAAQTVETATAAAVSAATTQANAAAASAQAAAQSALDAAAASNGMAPRMDAVEAANTQQNMRLDAVEAQNTQQNTALADKADKDLSNAATLPQGILAAALNASGSAPMYACRAWVNFNGMGAVAIRAGGNVSSVTDLGAGQYRINFANPMPDANYAASGGTDATSSVYANDMRFTNYTTTSVEVRVSVAESASPSEDSPIVSVVIHR